VFQPLSNPAEPCRTRRSAAPCFAEKDSA
jgi:hypothetical protein